MSSKNRAERRAAKRKVKGGCPLKVDFLSTRPIMAGEVAPKKEVKRER